MKRKDIYNLHMNGDHDYACIKKPPSQIGRPDCDKRVTYEGIDII